MCCFSRPVEFVGATRIFARGLEDGRQLLAYSMDIEIAEELAMVLPLPVPVDSADDAVTFIDLSGYDRFFADLEAAFPPDYSGAPQAAGFGPSRGEPEKPKLVVHDVGMFEASFVPRREDFGRLDPRFQLPANVWDQLPSYADFGFAVFRLKPKKHGLLQRGTARQRVHPMAFAFPRRDPSALFFPTVHVHDGASVPPLAHFDHSLFCQTDALLDAMLDWTPSNTALGASVDAARARSLIDPDRGGRRLSVQGDAPNADIVLRRPVGVTLADLAGRGETYEYVVRATQAHALRPWDDMRRAWKHTALTQLPALCSGLRRGLGELTAARRQAWALTALTDALPPHFVNGAQLWTGTDYMTGAPAKLGGPGRVALRIFTKSVEPQDITLAFAQLPDQEKLDSIRAELAAMVDRAARDPAGGRLTH